ncbi:membrane-associated phospholipid phosphatase [Neolewinella xylanilytica]|uniref:Membrane-associated phospholipid phosphatase n=1 Tax=Neolewinella xylanilytica TaxID=1514080 RepID=A0A2S6IBI5_9BACT|nr:phosphatase PAP2 family protein [Neolewinella xylanilytica]PPK88871.1 membrane-associated phospholipid phosphatase [Neolewinella xylanilytica]
MFRCFLLLLVCCSFPLTAQKFPDLDPEKASVYRVRTVREGLGGLAVMVGATTGIDGLRDKTPISDETLTRLQNSEIGRLDRWGLERDALKRFRSEETSDYFFNGSVLLPITLFIDKKFRKDWLDIGVLYLQAHALSAFTYAFSPLGPRFIDRYRPVAYYEELSFDDRRSGNNLNSFFSGHVSTTAVGTFFFTKVLSDYNPQWTGGHRAIAFTLASLPPAFVAVQRVRALKHFPTDTVVGLGVGAFFGVMVPHVHKVWARNHRSSLSLGGGYHDGAGGAGIVLTF